MEIQEKAGIVEMQKGQGGIHIISVLDGETITLEEDTPKGWDKFFMQIGVYCFMISVVLIIFAVIAKFLKRIFNQVMSSESPFSAENKPSLIKIFILLTVLVFMKDQIIGLICGFVFLYLYRLFVYGCELQVESDETL